MRGLGRDHRGGRRVRRSWGRRRFGQGEYRYVNAPYPEPIERLEAGPVSAAAADRAGLVGEARPPWPETLDEWPEMCHAAGQTKSTAILSKYGDRDWNALHRDLYGELVFPLQVVINLDEPGIDHTGGEFLLPEQRPRAQSRGTATLLPHGHGHLFTTHDRPVPSKRGWSAAPAARRLRDRLG